MEARREIVLAARMPKLPIVRLVKADEAAIYAHWDFLRARLIKFRKKFATRPDSKYVPVNWEPEHFRFEWLKNLKGNSTMELFLALGGAQAEETIDGFFITNVEYDPFMHIPTDWLIWIAWSCKRYLLESCWRQASAFAKARGCTGIKHMSPYLEWGRRQLDMNRRIAEVYGEPMPTWRLNYVVWRADLYEDDKL